MKLHILKQLKVFLVLGMAVLTGLSSCKTARTIRDVDLKPLSTGRLVRKVDQNAFDYDNLTIRRINCRFSSNQTNANFSIRLKAARDEKILLSIRKINIPVGRVLLTPDSVKYVNYIDQNYFVDDYSFISQFLNIDLDFETIQSIISNNAFSYRNNPGRNNFRMFDSSVEGGMYTLESQKMRTLSSERRKTKNEGLTLSKKAQGQEALIFQKMFFNPRNFALTKVIINDETNHRKLEMVFDKFEQVEQKEYPGLIEMNLTSAGEDIRLTIRMNGFSMEELDGITLRIPEKYEKIRVN